MGNKISVFNVQVYGIREALIRAGYPMATEVNMAMETDPRQIEDMLRLGNTLGRSPIGHGDVKFLRQIFVALMCWLLDTGGRSLIPTGYLRLRTVRARCTRANPSIMVGWQIPTLTRSF